MIPMIELKSELEGIIKLEVVKEDGTLKEAEGLNVPFKNLITDSGLNYVSGVTTIGTAAAYCRVGTGNTVPTVSDTALVSQVGISSSSASQTNSIQYLAAPYYSEHKRVYTFDIGAISGNLAEIGFFSDVTGGTMWSRALIKDSGGNPTVLTLLPTEQLKVTYTVIRYIPANQTGTFSLNTNGTNSTISYTITPANINSPYSPWMDGYISANRLYIWAYETNILGDIDFRPSGTVSTLIWNDMEAYTNGTFYRQSTATADAATANFASGIGSLIFFHNTSQGNDSSTGYQCSFSPKIMKTSSQTLAIGIRISWGRTTAQ